MRGLNRNLPALRPFRGGRQRCIAGLRRRAVFMPCGNRALSVTFYSSSPSRARRKIEINMMTVK